MLARAVKRNDTTGQKCWQCYVRRSRRASNICRSYSSSPPRFKLTVLESSTVAADLLSVPNIPTAITNKTNSQTTTTTLPLTVTTRARYQVSASNNNNDSSPSVGLDPFVVPLTVSDVHLRHEQLPFCYFFQETLDEQLLRGSLERVLRSFPVVAGRFVGHYQAIQCNPATDAIPLTVGSTNASLPEWLSENRGHKHRAGGGHPELLPLFDALLDNNNNHSNAMTADTAIITSTSATPNLATIRVTYFEGGGTAIGVNFLHALGDTASCVRFVHCWGREMQNLAYPRGASNIRANATVAGMMTEDLADLMGLAHERERHLQQLRPSWFASTWENWFRDTSETESRKVQEHASHEYLQMYFPPDVLQAMKAVRLTTLDRQQYGNTELQQQSSTPFVSTNDMVTAFGWLLKRSLSEGHEWNISIVVNLRGRCEVHAFSDILEAEANTSLSATAGEAATAQGVFGNGITNVVALHPLTDQFFGIRDVASAAGSIRRALQQGMLDLPDRLSQSRMGLVANHASTASTFATTSWGQFPLWDISFSPGSTVAAFHGHPSHPLPEGKSTYASVIMNTCNGSVLYKLLLPSHQVQEAQRKHQELCQAFLEAHEEPLTLQRQDVQEETLLYT